MRITAKTLKGEVINIDIEPEKTILDLKQMIHKEKGLEVQLQKIVFKGKATNNTDVLSDIGVKENDFLVVMGLIKKPEGAKKQQSKPEEKKQENKPAQIKPTETKPAETKPAETKTQVKQQQTNPQFQAKITELMSMGFQRQKCVAALRAAYNDGDRAVQYLLNGIPANIRQGGQTGAQGGQGNLGEGGQVENLFRALMANPNFAQIKQLIRNDPSTIQPIMQQIGQSSPELYAIIAQHPQAFQKVIMQDGPTGGVGAPRPPPPGAIHITPQQNAAIQRLMALGFTKIDAAQAYFACDKNQQLAANLLFDRQANGDLEPLQQQPGGQGGNKKGGSGGQGGQGGQSGQGGDDDDDNLFN